MDMGLREILLHNTLAEKWAYKHKNSIRVQNANWFNVPEKKARNNYVTISGTDNDFNLADGQLFSTCKIDISGKSNRVCIGLNTLTGDFANNTIMLRGNNNVIDIEDGTRLTSCSIFIAGNNNRIHICKDCSMVITAIHIEQDDNTVLIHEGCTFHGRDNRTVELALDEGTTITIQRDCMISNDVRFRSSDSHSIMDMDGFRLNPAADIIIAEHTWICLGCIILKGFSNGRNSVIAAGSICSKPAHDENVIIGGNPARLIKKAINWDRKYIGKEI